MVQGDVFALGRVYRNLLINAIQATAPGGLVAIATDATAGPRPHPRLRHRLRHSAGSHRRDLRRLRHHQTPRPRPRPRHFQEDRRAARRPNLGRQRSGQGHDLRARLPTHQSARPGAGRGVSRRFAAPCRLQASGSRLRNVHQDSVLFLEPEACSLKPAREPAKPASVQKNGPLARRPETGRGRQGPTGRLRIGGTSPLARAATDQFVLLARQNCVLELLGDAGLHDGLGGNLDRLTGGRDCGPSALYASGRPASPYLEERTRRHA